MPVDLALYGVAIPVLAAFLPLAVLWFWSGKRRSPPSWRWSAGAIAVTFAISLQARQGWSIPPKEAWEWGALAIEAAAILALSLGESGALAAIAAIGAGVAVGAAASRLPGHGEWSWWIGTGVIAGALAALSTFGSVHRTRASGALGWSASLVGISMLVFAGGFEKLATFTGAVAALCGSLGLLGMIAPRFALGRAATVALSALTVMVTAIGAAYADDLAFWHWPPMIAAPLTMLLADAPAMQKRPSLAAALRIAAPLVIVGSIAAPPFAQALAQLS